jgi:hypothetical protein
MNPGQVWLAIFGFVTAFGAALNNFVVVSGFVQERFLAVFSMSTIVVLYAIWPRRKRPIGFTHHFGTTPAVWRLRYVALVLIAYGAIATLYVWETKYRSTHEKWPYPNPRTYNLRDILLPEAAAREVPFKLVRFGLASSKTSFEQKQDIDFTSKTSSPQRVLTFSLMREWFQTGDEYCRRGVISMFSDWLDADLRTVRAFTFYLRSVHKENLVPYLRTDINQNFVSKRPDIASQIIPRGAEWNVLDGAGPEGQDSSKIILNWIKFCIGIPYPVFEFVVQNTAKDKDLIVSRLEYVVKRLGGYKGVEPGILLPLFTYSFDLPYKVGTVGQDLAPPLVVPKGAAAAFDLKLFTSHPDVGLGWKMAIRIVSSAGTVTTDDFQLLMSGEPTWAPQHLK